MSPSVEYLPINYYICLNNLFDKLLNYLNKHDF